MELVTLRGRAGNAHSGAVLIRNGERPVYIEGLAEWGDATGRSVEVIGVLVEQMLSRGGDGLPSHGLVGSILLLRNPSWWLLPE
ncbi:hypothetical protein D5S17_22200 [Pseudonocardiaceae bacterium YIM PH 21723]|nr:hypothetical protein D5S17_22200 [Pseudonocardiaceae bacterium YIM PH 21723]